MTCNVQHEDIVPEMPQNIERRLKAVGLKKIRNNDRQSAPPCFGAVHFKRLSRVRLSAWRYVGKETKNFEDAAFASLRRQFGFYLVGIGNHIDAIEIGKADVAERRSHSSGIVQLRRFAVV